MKKTYLLLSLIILFISTESALPESWNSFQDLNNILDMAVSGDDVWMTMEGGGVVKWNKRTHNYDRYFSTNGLADNETGRIFADSKGRIWVPNGGGISCCENGIWKFYGEKEGLSILSVISITEDKNGTLWFCSSSDVWSFNGNTWERYWRGKWSYANSINEIIPTRDGNVYFARDGGILRFDGKELNIFADMDNGLPGSLIYSIWETADGTLYAGSFSALFKYNGTRWESMPGIGTSEYVRGLAVDSHGIIWLATDQGAKKMENGQVTIIKSHSFDSVIIDSTGVVWFGSKAGGVLRVDGDTSEWQIENYSIYDLYIDKQNVLWAAGGAGVFSYTDGIWKKLTSLSSTAITEDTVGNHWIGTDNTGLYKYTPTGSWEQYKACGPFEMQSITDLATDSSGNLWVGAGGFVVQYDGKDWKYFGWLNSLLFESCKQVCVDGDNNKWFISSDASYLQKYDDNYWYIYDTNSDYNGFTAIGCDSNGRKWIVNRGSLYSFDETAAVYARLIKYDSIPSAMLQEMVIDSSDRKWFTTKNSGIYCLDGNSWTHFTKNEGLPDSVVNHLTMDDDGTIWACSSKGIAQFNNGRWNAYSIRDNCPGSNSVYCSAVDSEGRKWFGTANGLSCYSEGKWTQYSVEDGLASGMVTAIAFGADGSVWAGFKGYIYDSSYFYGGGLCHLVEGKWVHTHTNKNIDAIAIDRNGSVWIAYSEWGWPYNGGIGVYRDGQWSSISLPEEKRCFHIAFDRNNVAWFGLRNSTYTQYGGTIVSYSDNKLTEYANPDLSCMISNGVCDVLSFLSEDGTMLIRYDGSQWKTGDSPFPFGSFGLCCEDQNIPDANRFISEIKDANGNSWFNTRDGLVKNDGGASLLIDQTPDAFTLKKTITSMVFDSDNVLWITTPKGVFSYLSLPTSVNETSEMPVEFAIHTFPNPFNPSTTIAYTLPSSGKATLAIYDITGRKVRELADGTMTAGTHRAVWDGMDANGAAAASGIYFARVACGNRVATTKMLLMK